MVNIESTNNILILFPSQPRLANSEILLYSIPKKLSSYIVVGDFATPGVRLCNCKCVHRISEAI